MARSHFTIHMKILRITVVFLFYFFIGIPIHAEESTQQSSTQQSSNQQFEGFDLAGYGENGKKEWDVKGDTADILGSTIQLTNIVANAYGEEDMNITAKTGTLDKASGNMHLEQDVVITSENGGQLITDSLDWQKEKDLVTTNDDVLISQEGMTATGTGAVAHPGLSSAQLNERVTVNVNTDPKSSAGRMITITSDGSMEVEYEKGRAVFNKNVVAIDGDRKLQADQMLIFIDTKTNQIKEMICNGNVSVIQDGNTAYAEQATYKAGDKTLVLSGRPKLVLYTQQESGKGLFGDSKKE